MIGLLPVSLDVCGVQYGIRSDYRAALLVFEAFADPELSDGEKAAVCLRCLYKQIPTDVQAAYEKAMWFLDGGDMPKKKVASKPVLDWVQDESMIFSAVNRVAGHEVRSDKYMHWWTFLGCLSEAGECLMTTVLQIRQKKSRGKKLDKWEREFVRENAEMFTVKRRLSAEEQAAEDELKRMFD